MSPYTVVKILDIISILHCTNAQTHKRTVNVTLVIQIDIVDKREELCMLLLIL